MSKSKKITKKFDSFISKLDNRTIVIIAFIAVIGGLLLISYDYLKGKNPTIKTVMLKDFAKELGYILDKYKPSFLPRKEEKLEEVEE